MDVKPENFMLGRDKENQVGDIYCEAFALLMFARFML